jgi:N-acetylneuraminate synthase
MAFIIAEIGINHNGNLELAKQLISGAKYAGANAVKFQKRTVDEVYTKEELDKPRESIWGKTNREQKNGLELSYDDYIEIDKYCKLIDIEWFASAWDMTSAAFLKCFDFKYNKIASARLMHKELLEYTAKQRKYTFISTGMSTIQEIEKAVTIFKNNDCLFELMHCNSVYPCKETDLNLLAIKRLKEKFNCNVGYSGHHSGIIDCVVAATLGATSIEKHITLDRTMYGTDQPASLEIHGFKKMVEYVRFVELSLGDGIKRITSEEEVIKLKLRRDSDV